MEATTKHVNDAQRDAMTPDSRIFDRLFEAVTDAEEQDNDEAGRFVSDPEYDLIRFLDTGRFDAGFVFDTPEGIAELVAEGQSEADIERAYQEEWEARRRLCQRLRLYLAAAEADDALRAARGPLRLP